MTTEPRPFPIRVPRTIRTRVAAAVSVIAAIVSSWQPLQADEVPWEAIASDATFVARLDNPQKTIKDVGAFCELVTKGSGDRVQAFFSLLGEFISNPQLAGVGRGSNWWIAEYDDEDTGVLILPATDIKAIPAPPGKT